MIPPPLHVANIIHGFLGVHPSRRILQFLNTPAPADHRQFLHSTTRRARAISSGVILSPSIIAAIIPSVFSTYEHC